MPAVSLPAPATSVSLSLLALLVQKYKYWHLRRCVAGLAACTYHFFYNSQDLSFLVALQAAIFSFFFLWKKGPSFLASIDRELALDARDLASLSLARSLALSLSLSHTHTHIRSSQLWRCGELSLLCLVVMVCESRDPHDAGEMAAVCRNCESLFQLGRCSAAVCRNCESLFPIRSPRKWQLHQDRLHSTVCCNNRRLHRLLRASAV
jgi:hypothetical protein